MAKTPTGYMERKNEKFTLAGYSACQAALQFRWCEVQRFGSTPEKRTAARCPPIMIVI